jgi:hypothetical protein
VNHEELLRKIRACLRLSTSANEHEAAAALRQARFLMDRHGVSHAEALAGEVSEREAKTARRGEELHGSMNALIRLVEHSFRCRSVVNCGRGSAITVTFFGTGADAEVAAYAFEVLRRQMDSACKHHIRRVRIAKVREARGEAFRRGWVTAVWHLFPGAELAADLVEKLEAYQSVRWSNLSEGKSKDVDLKRVPGRDYERGVAAGRAAKLHTGLGGEQQRALESGS